jgi:myo-inositol-1(or 4)-monophosphatase
MALEFKGERIAGVVYDPCRNEMFAAGKGSGAQFNGRPIRVSRIPRSIRHFCAAFARTGTRHSALRESVPSAPIDKSRN